jgi:TRAP-type mannitol/chloroaromatic compound transport system permease small subunit
VTTDVAADEPHERIERLTDGGPPTPLDRILTAYANTVDAITRRLGTLSKYLVIIAVAIGFGNVLLRYVGRQTGQTLASNTYIELQWYLYGTLFLLAFADILRQGINVRVDFWYADLDRDRQLRIDLVGHTIALLPFTLLGVWVSWSRVLTSWGRRPDGSWPAGWRVWETWEVSSDAGGLPRAPIKTMILVAFVLLTLQALSEISKTIVALRGHEDDVVLSSGMVGAVKIE